MHGRAVRKTLEKYDIPGRNTAERAAQFYRDPNVRVVAGSRKHRYLLPLDADMRARIAPLAQPYPKRVKQATDGHHPDSDGAAPDPHTAPTITEARWHAVSRRSNRLTSSGAPC